MAKQINSKVLTDQDYIDHLVSVLPDWYKLTVQPLLKDGNVNIDGIKDAIVEYDEFWNKGDMSISSSDEKSEEDKTALDGIDKSEPRCYNCQKNGHYASSCPKKANKESDGRKRGKFKGKCNHCGRVGHKKADCWEKTELVLFHVNDEELKDELTLVAVDEYYPAGEYMFIANSGATADVITCVDYVKQSRLNVKGKQIIHNGKKLSPTLIGTYSFIQMDKNGNE